MDTSIRIENDTTLVDNEKKKPNKSKKKKVSNKKIKIPEKLQVAFHKVMIDSKKGDTIIMEKSKSSFYIPANAIRYKNGNLVTGKVEIRYREYREREEMIFSKIPMIFNENARKYRFNSAGMFEIRAFKNGKELVLDPAKPIVVDYNITDRLDNLNFYALDDETQEWSFLNQINLPNRQNLKKYQSRYYSK